MATKKELVEACSYSRRRLVAAFVSGAPGGHEAEPRRVGRTVVGGLALAVLLIAGAAVASVLTPQTPDDWNRVGLVVTRGDRPATYLILEESAHPTLIPVINLTSAQLILGADVTATALDQRLVDEQRPAIPIGIVGAPQTLPRSDAFIQTGWTACTADDVGVAVDLATDVKVEVAPGAGLIVRSADRLWLIATSSRREARDRRTYRYPIASAVDENLFVGYGLGALAEALDVPPGWLALFPEGGEVGPQGFGVPLGRPALDPPVPGAHVGDYVVGQGGGGAMVVDGGFQALDPFALAVLQSLRSRVNVVELAAGLPASYLPSTYAASHWPDAALRPLDSQPCAQLDVEP
ncbi:MAG TPA: type VII secretion protein EccB, partial [Nocardioides sp.]|nr:type VII secretion protein EccB [Nocardioides sp.]